MSASKLTMKFRRGLLPRSNSFFDRRKISEFVVNATSRDPRSPSPTEIGRDATDAGSTVALGAAITVVLRIVSKPKIIPTVIAAIHIAVIDLFRRPFAGHVKPSKRAGIVTGLAGDLYPDVALDRITGCLADPSRIPIGGPITSVFPSEYAGFWVVAQNLAYEISRQIALIIEHPSLNRSGIIAYHGGYTMTRGVT